MSKQFPHSWNSIKGVCRTCGEKFSHKYDDSSKDEWYPTHCLIPVEILLPKYYSSHGFQQHTYSSLWVVKLTIENQFFKTCMCSSCKANGMYWYPDDPTNWELATMSRLTRSEAQEVEQEVRGIRYG